MTKTYKIILSFIIGLVFPITAFAASYTVPWTATSTTNGLIFPLWNGIYQSIVAPFFVATSTTASSTFANGLNLTKGCFAINGTCFTGSGGGVSSVSGTWPIISSNGTTPIISWGGIATSSVLHLGYIHYSTGVNTFADVATGTLAATGPITVTAGQSIIGSGATVACNTASAGVAGCLNSTDWSTFNNKQSTITATWPQILTGTTLTFGGISTTSALTAQQLLYATGVNTVASVGTSTLSATSPLTGSFIQIGSGGTIGCQTASASQAGCLSSANWTTFNNKWDLASSTIPVNKGGTGATSFGQGWVGINDSGAFISSTSPTVNYITSTSTTATSTFANGIQLSKGCFSINGTCVGGSGGGGSGTVNSGTTGYASYYQTSGTAVSATSSLFFGSNQNIGIGTSSPGQLLTLFKAGSTAANSPQILFSASSTIANQTSYLNSWAMGTDLNDGGKFKISSSTVIGTNDRLVIDGNGNVGIGVSTPNSLLSVGNGTNVFTVDGVGNVGINISAFSQFIDGGFEIMPNARSKFGLLLDDQGTGNRSVGFYVDSSGNGSQYIYATGQVLATYINSSGSSYFNGGSLSIGNTSPATALDVTGTITQSTVKSCSLGLTTNSIGSITGCVASDEKLKTNISSLTDGNPILKLNPVFYNWKDKNRDTQVHSGFVAQQVEKVIPTAVVSAGTNIKGVDSNAILSYTVKFLQDFYTSFQKLVARVSGLESQLVKQQREIDQLKAVLIKNNIK